MANGMASPGAILGSACQLAILCIWWFYPAAASAQSARATSLVSSVTEEASVERTQLLRDEFAISPDGTLLAFVSVRPTLAANDNEWSLQIKPLGHPGEESSSIRRILQIHSPT